MTVRAKDFELCRVCEHERMACARERVEREQLLLGLLEQAGGLRVRAPKAVDDLD
ncbi:MAG: hypothetical protein JO120_03445 [Solirubrobacterales bacterium]|nr:hypothetical protein [Solirubrobacterales bacterium]